MKNFPWFLRAIPILFIPALIIYWAWGWNKNLDALQYSWYFWGAVMYIWLWTSVIICAAMFYLLETAPERDGPILRIACVITTVFIMSCLVYLPHSWMAWKIQPIVQKFLDEVGNGPDHQYRHESNADHDYVELDYGGRLNAILEERCTRLEANGFTVIGGWYTNGIFALYIYTGYTGKRDSKSIGP